MNYFNINFSLLFDPLSLFFICVILLLSFPAAIYSVGYLKNHYSPKKIVLNWVLFVLFIGSMILVVSARNAFLFLVAWEIMSLVSYFLVTFDSHEQKAVRAGTIYIVMTHIGTAFITAAILIMFKYANSFEFESIKHACGIMPQGLRNLLFVCFFIGFGTKAGIVPMHIWLPYAHPQAPSHISSLMSGVMIKTAVYGILRFIVVILGIGSLWWANLILGLALLSCFVGIMYALMDNDIKRLLAYSSVENMGIILLGVGAGVLFLKMNLPILAVLALAAGLYHLINHAIFKGLLFLGAGSIYKATGTRDIEKMGGLIKLMPVTAVCFLIGALSISAIPPLNGFMSEWLLLQAFFLGALNLMGGWKIFMGLIAAGIALTGGLAAGCFVKAFGITFLSLPRSKKTENAKEVSGGMKFAMIFLSVLAVCFGLLAPFILNILTKISAFIIGVDVTAVKFSFNNISAFIPQSNAYASASLLATMLILGVIFVATFIYFAFGKSKVSSASTWDCGYYNLTSRNEYTSTAFSKPFRIAFSFFLKPYKKTEKIRDSFYHVKSYKYEVFTTPVFKRYIYDPILNLVLKSAGQMRKMQPGSIHLYIAYIFIAVILLIIFMYRI